VFIGTSFRETGSGSILGTTPAFADKGRLGHELLMRTLSFFCLTAAQPCAQRRPYNIDFVKEFVKEKNRVWGVALE